MMMWRVLWQPHTVGLLRNGLLYSYTLVKPVQITYVRYMCTTDNTALIDEVKKGLKSNLELESKQIELLDSVLSNKVPAESSQLNLTGSDVFSLAVATFQAAKTCGVKMDPATQLFQYGHELGNIDSSYTYAQLLRTGQGCKPDLKTSAVIMTDLSMKAHPYAQFALAGMYSTGLGVEQNFNRAFTLYKVSAQNQVPQSFRALGDMYSSGKGINEDHNEAFKCYQRAVELGDVSAHMSLAQCYNHGKGVEQNFEKMFSHHLKAAESGIVVAIYNVGTHYFAGKGVKHSFEKAANFFQQAADLGFTPAQVNLGNMYYSGLGVAKDISKAKEFYKMAAEEDKNAKLLLDELELEE